MRHPWIQPLAGSLSVHAALLVGWAAWLSWLGRPGVGVAPVPRLGVLPDRQLVVERAHADIPPLEAFEVGEPQLLSTPALPSPDPPLRHRDPLPALREVFRELASAAHRSAEEDPPSETAMSVSPPVFVLRVPPLPVPEATAPPGVTRPRLDPSRSPAPAYPRRALLRGWEGVAVLGVDVAATGHPTGVRVLKSSGHAVLDRAAVRAVRGWRFQPARMGAAPIAGYTEVRLRFELRDDRGTVAGKRQATR